MIFVRTAMKIFYCLRIFCIQYVVLLTALSVSLEVELSRINIQIVLLDHSTPNLFPRYEYVCFIYLESINNLLYRKKPTDLISLKKFHKWLILIKINKKKSAQFQYWHLCDEFAISYQTEGFNFEKLIH